MRISILEAKFVRKKCALYTGKYGILETKPESVNVLEVCQTGTIKTTLSQGL